MSTVVFMRANLVIFYFRIFFSGVNNSLRDHGSCPFFYHHRPKLSDLPCGDHHHHRHYRYHCYYHHLPNHRCTILFDLLCSELLAKKKFPLKISGRERFTKKFRFSRISLSVPPKKVSDSCTHNLDATDLPNS